MTETLTELEQLEEARAKRHAAASEDGVHPEQHGSELDRLQARLEGLREALIKKQEKDEAARAAERERRSEQTERWAAHDRVQGASEHGDVSSRRHVASTGTPNKMATPENLAELTKDQLYDLAKARGLTVTRADGRDDLPPRVLDYVTALSG